MRHRPFWVRGVIVTIAFASAHTAAVPIARAEFLGCRTDQANPKDLLVITDRQTLRPWRLRQFPGSIAHSEPSTTGKYVGVLAVDPRTKVRGLWTFVLYVLDQRGQTVTRSNNAQAFKFSPDDRFIAITKGRPYEGATGFIPESTQIVDLNTRKAWTVPELKNATEVDWTNLPNEGLTLMAHLPTGKQRIWKYRMSHRRCEPTTFKGIHFSPDGRYYYLTPKEAIDAGLCRPRAQDSCLRAYSWRNKAVKLNLPAKARRLVGWHKKTGHNLVVTEGPESDAGDMEVDLATGRMKRLRGRIDRKWSTRRGLRITKQKSGQLRLWWNR